LWRSLDGLGVISDLQGNYVQAQASYQKALSLSPDSPQVLNNLGYSRYLSGQFAEAQGYFERALAASPGNPKAWSNMGLVHARLGHYPQAVSAFRELMTEPEAYYSAGYVCMLAHRWTDAGQLFQRAIELSPSYYEAAHQNLERVRNEPQSAAAMPAGLP
jgi:Flp pilus assembly protein TadD